MSLLDAYDPVWAVRGAALATSIRSLLGPLALRIEHIGSTSIPGMAAKPVLDLQVSVEDLEAAAKVFDEPLAGAGFVRQPWEADHVPAGHTDDPSRWTKRMWSRRSSEPVNLHCRLAGSPNERLALLFRDWFRAHPAAVPAYAAFKETLAEAVADDLGVYTDVKDPVVDLVITVAEEWARATAWPSAVDNSPVRVPPGVVEAQRRAAAAGFTISSEPPAGALLATLAAAVPPGGRILEIGTGVGTGLAWLVAGLGGRTDVEVRSVEKNPATHAVAAGAGWPANVTLHAGDVLELLDSLGTFDLIFADAAGGKTYGLDRTIAALSPGGHLLVDDMVHVEYQRPVRETLLSSPELTAVELPCGTGLILVTRAH